MRLDPLAVAPAASSAGRPDANDAAGVLETRPESRAPDSMSVQRRERLGREQRLRNPREFAAVRAGGTPFRGRYALLVVLPRPGEPTRVGFVASKRGVGGAVQRNRARRRLREIVRRRWPRIAARGYWMVWNASRGALDAPHGRLAAEVESLLASAGILAAPPAAEP